MEMKDEIIIDVKEVGHRIFKKWKILILGAIIGCFLMNIVGYINSYKKYQEKQPVDETTLEQYKSKLSGKELETAEQAYDTYEVYKKQYQSELEYSKNSILMKLATDNVATVEMQYYIDNHYVNVYPVIDQINNATDIIEAYSLRLTSSEVIDKIKENIGSDIEERYLRELISVEPIEDSQTMKINICSDSKELTNAIADVVEQEVNAYTQSIQEQYGEFDIIGANRSETTDIDDTLFELQQKEITSVATLRTQIDTVGSNLNDAQKAYYNACINNAESTKEKFQEKIVNKKNAVLGCGIGIIVVVCFIILRYVLQKQLRNQNDLRDIYNSYSFGVVEELDQKMDIIVEQITAFAIRGRITKVSLISTDVSEETQSVLQTLASKIKNDNLEICTACGINNIPNLLKKIEDTNHQVILVEKKNKSTYENIEREIKICEKCDIQILGNVVIDIDK